MVSGSTSTELRGKLTTIRHGICWRMESKAKRLTTRVAEHGLMVAGSSI